MAAIPHYIASEGIATQTLLPAVTPLLPVTQPLPSKRYFPGSRLLAWNKYVFKYHKKIRYLK
jgi:hypothetical protein